jgi:hypothetical protein
MQIFKQLPTLERVHSLLLYDPETGHFTNQPDRPYLTEEQLMHGPGRINKGGYINLYIDKIVYVAHRIAWLIIHKSDPGQIQIDHINRNRTDNRIINLRKATSVTQMNNKENNVPITFNGQTLNAAEWESLLGLSKGIVLTRLSIGWSIEKALTTPVRTSKTYDVNGELLSTKELSLMYGINEGTIKSRISKGLTGSDLVKPIDTRKSRVK